MKGLTVIIFILVLFVATLNAQDNKKPILIDEIGKTSCEDVLARTDNLGLTLKNNESASAYVIFYRNGVGSTKQDWQMRFIHRALIGRYGNQLNVTFLKKIADVEPRTEFWLVPFGANFSVSDSEILFRIPFKIDRKIMFDEDDPGPCSGHIPHAFVEMLKSDPTLIGYVVNINDPKSERATSIKYFLDFFRDQNITDRGIRIYFKKKKMIDDYSYGYTEYWLMPKKK